jgi:hypothetical protein
MGMMYGRDKRLTWPELEARMEQQDDVHVRDVIDYMTLVGKPEWYKIIHNIDPYDLIRFAVRPSITRTAQKYAINLMRDMPNAKEVLTNFKYSWEENRPKDPFPQVGG